MNVLNFSDFTAADLAPLTDAEIKRLEWVAWMFAFGKDEKADAILYTRELELEPRDRKEARR